MSNTENTQYLSCDEENKFREYYKAHLLKEFSLLEVKRKEYIAKFGGILFLFFLSCFTGVILYRNIALNNILGLIVLLILSSLIYWLTVPFKKYKKDAKKIIMPKFTKFFDTISYSLNGGGIDKNILKKSDLFMKIDDVYCDDLFEGSYKGTKFQLAEQRIVAYMHTRNGCRETTLFNGILLQFQFGKKFKGQTIVKDKHGQFFASCVLAFLVLLMVVIAILDPTRIQWVGFFICYMAVLTYLYWRKKYKNVYLEDVIFSKYWKVATTDQIEARYILTPSLMERILKIKKMFSAHSVRFAFFDDTVLIAISTNKDMFEISSFFSSATNYQRAKNVIAQFCSIFAIIDDIKQCTLDNLQKK